MIQNIEQLRFEMVKAFEQLQTKGLGEARAHEMSNAAGKIMHSCKVQLEYAHLRGEKPNIAFLNTGK